MIRNLFSNPKVECPRCLGKKDVSWDDIKRLDRELHWVPGECAYCNGTGEVAIDAIEKLNPNTTYLTLELSPVERARLFRGDAEALYRAEVFEEQRNHFIREIEYLHFTAKLNTHQIFGFYYVSKPEAEISEHEKQEFIEYLEKVISHKK